MKSRIFPIYISRNRFRLKIAYFLKGLAEKVSPPDGRGPFFHRSYDWRQIEEMRKSLAKYGSRLSTAEAELQLLKIRLAGASIVYDDILAKKDYETADKLRAALGDDLFEGHKTYNMLERLYNLRFDVFVDDGDKLVNFVSRPSGKLKENIDITKATIDLLERLGADEAG